MLEGGRCPPKRFLWLGGRGHDAPTQEPPKKTKNRKKNLFIFNYHNFKYKMTLPLIDQKMTMREQYQRMTTLFINISTKLNIFLRNLKP